MSVERINLAPGLSVSRVLTGLWQIADMERDGRTIDLAQTAAAMRPYVDAGLTSFDMADHYGSAEDVAGIYRDGPGGSRAQLLTKWVPKPGPVTREDVRGAIDPFAHAAPHRSPGSAAVPRLDLRGSQLAGRAVLPAGAV